MGDYDVIEDGRRRALARRAEFAVRLNEARIAHQLSVRESAKVANVPAATMQGWLQGRHFPTPALRPKFLIFVERVGMSDEVEPELWDSVLRPEPVALSA